MNAKEKHESDERLALKTGMTPKSARETADRLARREPTPYQAFALGKYVGEIVGRVKAIRQIK